jgi:hypothetical protein
LNGIENPGSGEGTPPTPTADLCNNAAPAYGDSANQGYDKEHEAIDYPYDMPKGAEPGGEETVYNKGLSRFPVRVEHKIGPVKRFRIVSDGFRNPRRTHFTKTSIIAGLVNMESGFEPC